MLRYLFIGLALLISELSFAEEFRRKLVERDPTITITYPSQNASITNGEMEIRWSPTPLATSEFLGFILQNEDTEERKFIGDAFNARQKVLKRPVGGVKPGRYRIIGYHYGLEGDWTVAGESAVFNLGPTTQKKFWTKWGQEEKMCRYFAGTDHYIMYDLKEITCTSSRCVDPKFYWMPNSDWALLEDRPSSLPDDKSIISIRCAPIPYALTTP